MWSYYGRKSKIIKYYPKPIYDTIIEPFAGTAVYSLYQDNWKKNIILVDKYKLIIDLWKWLIQVSEQEILNLPDMNRGDKITDLNICSEAKHLIGFCINRGSQRPKLTASGFNSWNKNKKEIAKNLYKIRHWKAYYNTYKNIPNKEATWFIDPPYQFGGELYVEHTINFKDLSKWCQSRQGQVIVCENDKANWLSFQALVELQGQRHRTQEVIYYKEKIDDNENNEECPF